jgi:hypothetical protein
MGTTITIDVDDATRDEFAKAAADAGQTLIAYIVDATHERRLRDAALRGDRSCDWPGPAAAALLDARAAAAARLAGRAAAAEMRAAVLAKYH